MSRHAIDEIARDDIKELKEEFENQTRELVTPEVCGMFGCYGGEATLNGKIEAIAAFLGIDFSVEPERVVASKVKAVKKGKK